MISKKKLITELYTETVNSLSEREENWVSFISSASMNYKYAFNDQVLIYAQRPDAIACADIETWNKTLDRWVNKGSKGIALLVEENGYIRLKYVFDVNDTNNRYGKEISLWKINKSYELDVIESLENRYGDLEVKENIQEAIMSASYNIVQDNIQDYLRELDENIVEELTEDNIQILLSKSIAYIILNRCGYNTDDYISITDFDNIKKINTLQSMTVIGNATSDMSEMALREIYTTLKNIRISEINKIRTFDKNESIKYDIDKDRDVERSDFNDNIYQTRGLRDSKPSVRNQRGEITGEIRNNEIELSERKQEIIIPNTDDERSTNRTFTGNRSEYEDESRGDNDQFSEERKSNRGIEVEQSNEMGWNDEQYQAKSNRDSITGTNIQLKDIYEKGESNLPYFYDDDEIRGILRTTPHLKSSRKSIKDYYNENKETLKRAEFIKQLFDNSFIEVIVEDIRYGYKAYDNGLLLWKGAYLTRKSEAFYDWNIMSYYFEAMIMLKELDDRVIPIPTLNNQLSLIEESNIENKLIFPQEVIDTALKRGSGIESGKLRIYEQLTNSLDIQSNIKFLKDEYGTGGSSSIHPGLYISEEHSPKGITLSNRNDKLLLKWNEVEKRVRHLISDDRYLNSKEKEEYPIWLEKRESENELNRKAKELSINDENETLAVRIHDFIKDFDNYAYSDDFSDQDEEDTIEEIGRQLNNSKEIKGIIEYLEEAYDELDSESDDKQVVKGLLLELREIYPEYEYHLGDKVFIGLEEYEILAFDNQSVRCYDYQYPLFQKEFSRDEFDEKVRATPSNEHLIIKKDYDIENIASLVDEKGFEEQTSDEYEVKDNNEYDNYIGKTIEFNDRKYFVESINSLNDEIELRDITFQSQVGLPISRIDKLSKILKLLEDLKEETIIPNFEKKQNNKVKTFDIHPEINNIDRHNFKINNDLLGNGSPREKFKNNIEAIKILQICKKENRFATVEEQEVLSKYIGWGGLSQCFDSNNSSWATEYLELKDLLSEEEYKNARESTLTAFYTPPVVIRAMYKALNNMGLKTGNILEPSCGTGNFIGMLPTNLEECKIYGVELDSVSGRIAQHLYQKSSIAVQGFENTKLPNSFFDIAIGNVPFGDFKVLDKKYDKHKFLIHDYFFAKTIDKVRPGGIVAFITSKGTMDKENPTFRRYLSQRSDLLGAIRLPNNTFKDNAGTEVTADILFLQKRDSITDIEPDWVYLDTDENNIKMNKYFVDNPEMILGEMKMHSTQYGFDSTCEAFENSNLESLLEESISNIHTEIKDYIIEDIGEEEDLSIPADLNVRNFSYTIVNNQLYFRENSKMYPKELPLTITNRIKSMIEIRDVVRSLIEYQTEDYPDVDIKREQTKLNVLYDDFNKKYGLINSRANANAFSDDSSYFLLCSLEVLNEKGELVRKADIFNKRTIKPKKEITSVDTANEALIVSISEKAKIDIEYMSSLTNKSEQELISELKGIMFKLPNYQNDEIKYVTADEYLSGNVREKLKEALKFYETDMSYESNVKALQEVQPKDLSASEISVRLGATWLPVEDVQDFMYELLECSNYVKWNVKVHYFEYTGEWNIEGKSYDRGNVKANSTYGTSRINAYKIIEETLNLKDVRIYDYVEDEEGKKQQILNKKETAIAQAKQEQIKTAFDEWIWTKPERRERLTKLYNEKFNSIRPREYDGTNINFGGINSEISLRPHQLNAIARILYGKNTLLAHEVGAGKTWEMVAGSMESKRLELCSKSLIIVPNHIIEQFAGEFLQLYPTANVLVATKKDFETANRKKFCSRIATGEFDAVIIGHSQFEKIPMSIPRQKRILEKQIEEITYGINDLKKNRGENFSIKQLEKTKKSIQNKLEKLNDQSKKDNVITFEELGVDKIFVDEAHYYKNLFLYTKMRNVGGIAQTEAQKSSDLFMKCRYLDELTGGRGIVFATGTPISNSMVELYTMQRYLQMNTLEQNKMQHFDSWASTFGETITAIELAPEGTGYRAKTRFAKFYNLPELMNMFKEVADIQTQDMLNLPVPQAHYENVVIKPSKMQEDMVKELAERAERVRNKMVDATTDNMLKITNDGRKLALDQRLLNDLLPDYEFSKVSICANNVYKIWEENKIDKLTQLVFCDLSTPKADGSFNVYDDLKKKLLDKGIPDEEVVFIHEADTEVRKKELFAKVRKGQVRVLIGSTQKMGAGTNCQDKLIALHDLDCPWRPSDLIQRSGRIIRQGNQNPEVFIYRYVTEKTFDAYLYQLVENKQRFISQIMTGKSPVRTAEDIDETALSYAEIKALAAGNPLIIEKTDLDTQVSKLRLLKQSHLSQIYAIEDKVIKYYPSEIKRLEVRIEALKDDIKQFVNNDLKTEEKFQKMILNNITYTDKTEAGNKILELCKQMTSPEPILIGEYKGFKMELVFDSFSREFNVNLKSQLSHNVRLGSDNHGNITRIDNVLASLPDRLEESISRLNDTKKQYENAKIEINRPFPQEEELKKKSKRLDELNIVLNMNEKDKEIIDGEPKEPVTSQIYKRDKER